MVIFIKIFKDFIFFKICVCLKCWNMFKTLGINNKYKNRYNSDYQPEYNYETITH